MRQKVHFLIELAGSLWLVTNWLSIVERPRGKQPNTVTLRRLHKGDAELTFDDGDFEYFDRLTEKLRRRKSKERSHKRRATPPAKLRRSRGLHG